MHNVSASAWVPPIITKTWDKKGNIIKKTFDEAVHVLEYDYDDYNNLLYYIRKINGDTTISSTYYNYDYDKQGNIIKVTMEKKESFPPPDEAEHYVKCVSNYKNEYDEHGRLKKTMFVSGDGCTLRLVYEYDYSGEKLSEKRHFYTDNLCHTIERFEYLDDHKVIKTVMQASGFITHYMVYHMENGKILEGNMFNPAKGDSKWTASMCLSDKEEDLISVYVLEDALTPLVMRDVLEYVKNICNNKKSSVYFDNCDVQTNFMLFYDDCKSVIDEYENRCNIKVVYI